MCDYKLHVVAEPKVPVTANIKTYFGKDCDPFPFASDSYNLFV